MFKFWKKEKKDDLGLEDLLDSEIVEEDTSSANEESELKEEDTIEKKESETSEEIADDEDLEVRKNKDLKEEFSEESSEEINNDLEEDIKSDEVSIKSEGASEEALENQGNEKPKGIFSRLLEGLSKTKDNITGRIDSILNSYTKIDEDLLEELEEILETLGFTSLDLLNKDNAASLFLIVNEEINLTNLITNEDLMSQYNSFMELLKDMRENLNNDMWELLGFKDIDVEAIVKELTMKTDPYIVKQAVQTCKIKSDKLI